MIATWMIWAIAVGACAGTGAVLLDWVLRAHRRPTRWAWCCALLGTTVLMIAAPFADRTPDAGPATVAEVVRQDAGRLDPIGTVRAALARTARWVSDATVRLSHLDRPLLVAWASSSLLFAAVLLLGHRRLARERATWPVGRLAGSRVRVSPDLGPAVVGWRHPEIVVPQWALSMAEEEQRLITLHEREHLDAGDQHLVALALLLVVVAPWNPAHWWMLQRLRLAIEIDCDRRALAAGANLRSYGELLMRLGSRGRPTPVPVAALAEGRSTLVRRVRVFTAAPPKARWTGGLIGAGLSLLLFGTAGALPVPVRAPVASPMMPTADAGLVSPPTETGTWEADPRQPVPVERGVLRLREVPPDSGDVTPSAPERRANDATARVRPSATATPVPGGRGGRVGGGGRGGRGDFAGRYVFDSLGTRQAAPTGAVIRARAIFTPGDTSVRRPPF